MDIWEILGIEPTTEIVAIKKAYAGQLKLHHPEDDPQGFQCLREAYDSALKLAKFAKDNPSFTFNPDETDLVVTEVIEATGSDQVLSDSVINEAIPPLPPDTNYPENEVPEYLSDQVFNTQFPADLIENTGSDQVLSDIVINEAIPPLPPWTNYHEDEAPKFLSDQVLKTQFLEKIEQLYHDFFRRIELENWQALFNSIDIWNINIRNQLSNALLVFFIEHHHLPVYIWDYIDGYFQWSKQADTYDFPAPDQLIESITKQITGTDAPWYALFRKIDGFDYEKFLNSRDIALNSSMDDIPGEASEYYMAHAEAVYPEDPQLEVFSGKFYFKTHDFYKAKGYLEKAIQTEPIDDTLPALLIQVDQEIKTSLVRELFKQPWRKGLIRQYFLTGQEIKTLKKNISRIG
ncbi:MAG TPA: J domain-containing protein [Bacillota bacterium]|nr:J domain-containing protein [Bacillota bacterium]